MSTEHAGTANRDLVVSVAEPELLEALGEINGVRLLHWELDGPPPEPHIDLVVPRYIGANETLAHLEGVSTQLVQGQSIGYDGVAEYLPPGHRYANAATVHETSTAELAVGLTLAAQRGIVEFSREGGDVAWFTGASRPSLADRRVLIIGYGGIGKAVDRRLTGFEALVTRVATSPREEVGPEGTPVRVHGIDDLYALLPDAEIVILTVPLNDTTHHLVNAETLALLPDGALVVNVARGQVIDTDALVAAVRAGRVRAALDVTDPEPLPSDHPLWGLHEVIITPHVGGDSTAMRPRVVALIKRQIARLRRGEPVENVVIEGDPQ